MNRHAKNYRKQYRRTRPDNHYTARIDLPHIPADTCLPPLLDSVEFNYYDIPNLARVVLVLLAAVCVLTITGCGTVSGVEQVGRIPPAAAMVKMQPLGAQTDPTLGGVYVGYLKAVQSYHSCTRNLYELQDFVNGGAK